jgi:type VI secretion system secreted protein VgrG
MPGSKTIESVVSASAETKLAQSEIVYDKILTFNPVSK